MWKKLDRSKSWSELSRRQKMTVLLLATVQSALLVTALRDISHRSDDQINGSRRKWQAISFINIAGPLYYFRYGRRSQS